MKIVKADSEFLMKHNIMDYSFLLVIENAQSTTFTLQRGKHFVQNQIFI